MNQIVNGQYVGVDQRQAPRTDVYARIPVTLPDGRQVIVTVVNISADGLLMRHDQKLEDGSIVYLSLPVLGKVAAQSIWSLGGRSGVQFLDSISLRDYAPLLRAFGARVTG